MVFVPDVLGQSNLFSALQGKVNYPATINCYLSVVVGPLASLLLPLARSILLLPG